MVDVKALITQAWGCGAGQPCRHTCLSLPKGRVLGVPVLDGVPEGNHEPGLEDFGSIGRGWKCPQPLGTQLPSWTGRPHFGDSCTPDSPAPPESVHLQTPCSSPAHSNLRG